MLYVLTRPVHYQISPGGELSFSLCKSSLNNFTFRFRHSNNIGFNLGHPSCLDMTPELVAMIKTYPWQCMECKTCIMCGQPHHEEEMMFCDVCDRGYHTFCVGLDAIPSGNKGFIVLFPPPLSPGEFSVRIDVLFLKEV